MTVSLEESHEYCQSLSRRTGRNFYYSFLGLRPHRYRAMCALYAFMRLTDDLGDDERMPCEVRHERLAQWRADLAHALAGRFPNHPVYPALAETVERFQIPPEYLFAVVDGVTMDLHPRQPATFPELADYCYHVAGAVGLCCIHIWGFTDPRAITAAIDCGTALQLTNILRDLKEDADMGRVYLPAEDLEAFGYSIDDLQQHCYDDRFRRLMSFQADRARGYYAKSEELFAYLKPGGRPILRAMLRIYGGLLQEIERREYDVFSSPIALPTWKKLLVAADAMIRQRWTRHQIKNSSNAVADV